MPNASNVPRLALSAREAAQALSLSERSLDTLVAAGAVPIARIGRRRLFPVTALQRWLDDQTTNDVLGEKGVGDAG